MGIQLTIMNSCCVLIILCSLFISEILSQNMDANNYGPYKPVWQTIAVCKGPKQGDCGATGLGNKDKMNDVIFYLNITKECPITMTKIMVNSKQANNSTKKLWHHIVNKPCQHFVLGAVLSESLGIPEKDCKVGKGTYSPHVNLLDKTLKFLGTSFFYGSYAFKILIYNKADNFLCFYSELDILKK